jgi:hypothetical protein
MLWVTAFIDQILRSLMRSEDGYELVSFLVGFTEVGTESTLSIVNFRHDDLQRRFRGPVLTQAF